MEIRERIDACLGELEARRRTVVEYRERVKGLVDALKADGGTPGKLGELFSVLDVVLNNYDEIGQSCSRMIQGLTDIGQHLDRIEDGRNKILNGVESILKNLSQLDRIAEQGMPLAVGNPLNADPDKPKRVLLIRIRPEENAPSGRDAAKRENLFELGEDPLDPATGKPIVH